MKMLRLATSVVELIVALLAYLWAGWPGIALYVIGAVLIGCNRALLDAVAADRGRVKR